MRRLSLAVFLIVACGEPEASEPGAPEDVSVVDVAEGDTLEQADRIESDAAELDADEDAPTEPDTQDSGPPAPELPKGAVSSKDYQSGGVVLRVYDGAAASPESLKGVVATELFDDLDLNSGDPRLAGLNDGAPMTARFSGGLSIAESGVYRLVVVARGSVEVTLGGVLAVEVWGTGQKITRDKTIQLDEGWFDLDVVYARSGLTGQLQLFLAREGGLAMPLTSEQLGWSDSLPDDVPELTATAELLSATAYGAKVVVQTSAPCQWSAVAGGQPQTVVQPESAFTQDTLLLNLPSSATSTVSLSAVDIFGRTASVAPFGVDTPAPPVFNAGGLQAEYFQGGDYKDFEFRVAHRIDPQILFPDLATAGFGSSWGLPMGVDKFAVRWLGGLLVPEDGAYTLYFGSDDGQRLYVDGALVADGWYDHSMTFIQAELLLQAGWHDLRAEMYQNSGGAAAVLEWSGPSFSRRSVSPAELGSNYPTEDGEKPQILSAQAGYNDDLDRISVHLHLSEIAAVQATLGGVSTDVLGPADRFAWQLDHIGPAQMTLQITDLAGKKSAATLQLAPPEPPAGVQFVEPFDADLMPEGWTVVEQGLGGPSAWIVKSGSARETGNGYTDDPGGGAALPKRGSYLQAPTDWLMGDGTFSAHIYQGDNDAMGLMYAVAPDSETYYRISLDHEVGYARLVKADHGVFTAMAELPDFLPLQNHWSELRVERNAGVHTVWLDGQLLMVAEDDELPPGGVALYAWAMSDARFDNPAVLLP